MNTFEKLEELSKQSLLKVSLFLDSKFSEVEPHEWVGYEVETISLELNPEGILPDLLRDKIELLQTINARPDLFYNDILFFVYTTDVVNNTVADFSTLIFPTSLEVIASMHEVREILDAWKFAEFKFSPSVIVAIAYILREDGYSEPLAPFDFVPKDFLADGQTDQDTQDKARAIKMFMNYLKAR